jgi:hypothetical protein
VEAASFDAGTRAARRRRLANDDAMRRVMRREPWQMELINSLMGAVSGLVSAILELLTGILGDLGILAG